MKRLSGEALLLTYANNQDTQTVISPNRQSKDGSCYTFNYVEQI